MPRKFFYRDTPQETTDIFRCIARAGEDQPVYTGWLTPAACYAFRNRIYRWRRTILDILARAGTQEEQEVSQWLTHLFPDLTIFPKEFLDLTIFQLEGHPTDSTKMRLLGTWRRPIFVDPERSAYRPTKESLEESLRLLQEATGFAREKEDL